MTSIVRSHFSGRSLPSAPGFIPATFTNSEGYNQPFPWRYNKQTQAIDLAFVDGFSSSTTIGASSVFFRGQQFGGLRLVQALGPNFITWCETNTDILADAGSVRIHEAPVVVNANLVAPSQNPNDAATNEETFPVSFETSAGTEVGQYCKTLVFMRPMVIKYTRSGTEYYRWFSQNFEGNS